MNTPSRRFTENPRVDFILSTLYDFRKVWVLPAIAGLILSAFYVVFVRAEIWSAKQSLIVRDDLLGNSFKPGRFDSLESMKSAQETILEIARKPHVIRNSLKRLGQEPRGWFSMPDFSEFPSEKTIETVQGAISLSAPNGAELGKTEVIVLNAKGSSRDRARQFMEILMDEIIVKTNEVRSLRLKSMVNELEQARNAAWESLDESKARLRLMDETLGPDIGSLGAFDENQSGNGALHKDIAQLQLEKRAVDAEIEKANKLLEMLVAARQNPQQLINTSGDLIKYQPGLEVLKKELVSKQQVLATLIGSYTVDHPRVMGARESILAMKTQMYNELLSSIVGMEQDISALRQKGVRLDMEIEDRRSRLDRVSSSRVDSLTALAEVRKRTEIANNAESDLQEIKALSLSANNVDLITKVDAPQVSTRPDGLGKKATVLVGGIAGLLLGLGMVMLLAPPMDPAHAESTARLTPPEPEQPTPTRPRTLVDSSRDQGSTSRATSPTFQTSGPASTTPMTTAQASGGSPADVERQNRKSASWSQSPLTGIKAGISGLVSNVANWSGSEGRPEAPPVVSPAPTAQGGKTLEQRAEEKLEELSQKSNNRGRKAAIIKPAEKVKTKQDAKSQVSVDETIAESSENLESIVETKASDHGNSPEHPPAKTEDEVVNTAKPAEVKEIPTQPVTQGPDSDKAENSTSKPVAGPTTNKATSQAKPEQPKTAAPKRVAWKKTVKKPDEPKAKETASPELTDKAPQDDAAKPAPPTQRVVVKSKFPQMKKQEPVEDAPKETPQTPAPRQPDVTQPIDAAALLAGEGDHPAVPDVSKQVANDLVDQAFEAEARETDKTIAMDSSAEKKNNPPISAQQAEVLNKILAKLENEGEGAEDPQLSRRTSNVRPVDLAKSAQEDSFDRVPPAKPDASGNPFLKSSGDAPDADETKDPSSATAPGETDEGVPEQIRKLSDAISSFTTRKKQEDEKGWSDQ